MIKRILVTGSRKWRDRHVVESTLINALQFLNVDKATLVHGACPSGADHIADEIWSKWGMPVERHPANWDKLGKRAGVVRNAEMVKAGADVCRIHECRLPWNSALCQHGAQCRDPSR